MTTVGFNENLSVSIASHEDGERPVAFPGEEAAVSWQEGQQLAQAETQQGAEAAVTAAQPGVQTVEVTDNVVKLPAGTSIEKVEIDGDNLVLVQPDGSRIVIENAALHVPTFVIDDVEIPQEALVAALEASNINVAAGPDGGLTASASGNASAGGNFSEAIPGIGDAGPAIDLLDPTALQFGTLDEEILLPAFANRGPSISLDGNTGGAGGIAISDHTVYESHLPGGSAMPGGVVVMRLSEGEGSNQEEGPDLATVTGTFTLSDPDGLSDIASITINGTSYALGALTGVEIQGEYGVLTIVSFNAATGAATYSYTLTSPFKSEGPNAPETEQDKDIFTLTITDRGGLSASANLRIDIVDDTPEIRDEVRSEMWLEVDEANFNADDSTDAAAFFKGLTIVYGADGAAEENPVVYMLTLEAGEAEGGIRTGLFALDADTDTGNGRGEEIVLSQDPATGVISGMVGTTTYFTITLKDGKVTLDQKAAIWHEQGGDSDDVARLNISNGSLTLTVKVTDGDGDTDSRGTSLGNGVFTFLDQGPAIAVDPVEDDAIKIVTQDADTVESNSDEASNSFAAAFLAAVKPTYGPDQEGSVKVSDYKLTIDNAASGLTIKGVAITLSMVGDDVVGSATGHGNVFRINVDADGKVTLTQYQQIDHNPAGSNHVDLSDGKVTLSATATVKDGDGDTVTDTVSTDLGGNIGFDDALPTVTITPNANFSITHDETFGLDSWPFGDADDILRFVVETLFNGVTNPGHDPDTLGVPIGYARSSGPVFSVNADYGADGAAASGARVFSLKLTTAAGAPAVSIDSGLETTDGHAIFLYQENGLIVGRYDDGGQGADPAAFAILIDPATGVVTMVQYVSLAHDDAGDPDDVLSLSNAIGKVQATVTIKDGDGDTDTASSDIGGSIRFEDDGPHIITVGVKHGFDVTADETIRNQNDDVTGPLAIFNAVGLNPGSDPDRAGQPLAFATSKVPAIGYTAFFGTDGAAAQAASYALGLKSEGVDSGLKTTAGEKIFLYTLQNGDDTLIVGRVGGPNGPAAIALAIDSASGKVSVVEYLSLQHNLNGNSANDEISLAQGTVRAIVTIEDGDGDTDKASVDISGNINFRDDGPSFTLSGSNTQETRDAIKLNLDETVRASDVYKAGEQPGSGEPNGQLDNTANTEVKYVTDPALAKSIGHLETASGAVANFFKTSAVDYGADGAAAANPLSAKYSFVWTNDDAWGNSFKTNLSVTASGDLATANSAARLISLSINNNGDVIGKTGSGHIAFRISLDTTDPANPKIVVDQYLPIAHDKTGAYDEALSLLMAGDNQGISLQLSVTAKDGDNDTVTQTAEVPLIGKNSSFLSFDDDGPTAVADTKSLSEDTPSVTGNVLTNDIAGTDGGAKVTTTGNSINGTYGTLKLNADGSYTYTLKTDAATKALVQALVPGEKLEESFDYTMKDGDGDTSSSKLTITINGADDGVTLNGLNGANGELTVSEANLSDGSSPNSSALVKSGTFTFTALDGAGSVKIGDKILTLGNSQQLVAEDATGKLVVTSYSYNAQTGVGTVNYTYTLKDNTTAHGPDSNGGANSLQLQFPVEVTDRNGSPANGSLDINIVDDIPKAQDDANNVVIEDDSSHNEVSGNVLDNDTHANGQTGADGKLFAAWGGDAQVVADLNKYGELELNGDGTWSFTLDNTKAATQALKSTESLNFVLNYTMKDGDGDTSPAKLTITVKGTNDAPVVTVDTGNAGNANDRVLESGLLNGSAAGTGHVETGTLTLSDRDGLGELKSISINNGDPILIANLMGASVQGAYGKLLITGYANGVVSYKYTLENVSDDRTSPHDTFTVTVTDGTATSAAAQIRIDIVDDLPKAKPDSDSVTEDGPKVADGNVLNAAGGTDANQTDGVADVKGADGATVTGVWFGQTAGTLANELSGTYGKLVLNADGSYTYTLNNNSPLVQGLSANETRTDTFTYEITDGDGDKSSTTLTITINGTDDGVTLNGLNVSGGELTVDEENLNNGSSPDNGALVQPGVFTFTALDGVGSVKIGSTTLNLGASFPQTVSDNALGKLVVTGYAYDSQTGVGTVNYTYTLKSNTLAHGPDSNGNENSVGISFDVLVQDRDGSPASGVLDINIIDDVPLATTAVTGAPQVTEGHSISGNWSQVPGADGLKEVTFSAGTSTQTVATSQFGTVALSVAGGTITFNQNGSWTFVSPNNSVSANQNFTFTVKVVDKDGDESSSSRTIDVLNGAAPTTTSPQVIADEDNLSTGNNDTPVSPDDATQANMTGSLGAYGLDGVGSVTFAAQSGSAVTATGYATVTSGGAQLYYYWDAAAKTLYGTTVATQAGAASNAAFKIVLSNEGTGTNVTAKYEFTLIKALDHKTAGTEDDIDLSLGYTIKDGNDDATTGTLKIKIDDDMPVAKPESNTLNIVSDNLGVSEVDAAWKILTGGQNITYSAASDGSKVLVEWGGEDGGKSGYGFVDGPAAVLDNLQTNQTFYLGEFTHYNKTIDTGTSISSAQLTVSFMAIINGEETLVGPITIKFEHNETSNTGTAEQNRDIIKITTQTATVNIAGQNYTLAVRGFVDENNNVVNEVRTYEDKENTYKLAVSFVSSGTSNITATGNVLDNEEAGADRPLQVTVVSGISADNDGNFQVVGQYGTLTINKNGTYTYTLTKDASLIPAASEDPKETFNYTVKDFDGDLSTATLTIDLNKVPSPVNPLHGDRVITNISGSTIAISEAALLFNDQAGSQIGAGASNPDDLTVSHPQAGNDFIVTDSDSDGGKFTYSGTNNGNADDALVTVIRQTGSTLTGTAFGDILIGRDTASADTINGGAGNDYIVANAGDDIIDGGAGADTMLGGAGSDTYTVDDAGDVVVEAANAGTDTVKASVNYTLGANVENLTLTGTGNINGTGNGLVNVLTGNSGKNVLSGGAGGDTLNGGGGDDRLEGGADNDTLNGGDGNDTYVFGLSDGTDTINDSSGTDTIAINAGGAAFTSLSFLDSATNSTGDLVIDFNGQKITVVNHFDGDDEEVETISFGGGSFAGYALGTGTYDLSTDDRGTRSGDGGNDVIAGDSNGNTLNGDDGNDLLFGNDGDDTLSGGAGADLLVGGNGADTLTGGGGGDTLVGGAGKDTFVIVAGDSTATVMVSGDNSKVSGYDRIVDWGTGGTADKLSLAGTLSIGSFSVSSDPSKDSTATVGGQTIKSHAIVNGMITFDVATGFGASLNLNSEGRLAAAVEYLQKNDVGSAGATLAFAAMGNTYIYTQGGSTNTNGTNTLVELTDITTFNLSSIIGGAVDPIVVDLDHNGYSFSDVAGGIHFDINADGAVDQVAWNTSNDGILAYDVNGDGKIDSGSEIFTPDFAGGKFANGAAALASLDSNGDGIIDADDEAFSKLLIWQDANGDGVGAGGELSHLADHGISGIGTATTTPAVDTIDGQTIAGEGTVYYADGSTGNYVEVHLDAILGDGGNLGGGSTSDADTFVIDPSVLVSGGGLAEILTGYNAAEGDVVDISQLLGDNVTADNIGDFVRTVESGDGAADQLQVSTSGQPSDFATVAVLDANSGVKILYNDDQHHTQNATV